MKKLAIVLVILSLLLSGTVLVGSACGSGTCGVCGRYVSEDNPRDDLQLNADGRFVNHESGSYFSGTWKVYGNTITLKLDVYGFQSVGTIQGNALIDKDGVRWVKQ